MRLKCCGLGTKGSRIRPATACFPFVSLCRLTRPFFFFGCRCFCVFCLTPMPMLMLYLATYCLTRVSFRKEEMKRKGKATIPRISLPRIMLSRATLMMPKISAHALPPLNMPGRQHSRDVQAKILWHNMPVKPTFQQHGSAVVHVPLSRGLLRRFPVGSSL
jgi:hypothetical protein